MQNSQNYTYNDGFYTSKYANAIYYLRSGPSRTMSRKVNADTCLNYLELFSSFHPNSIFAASLKPVLLTDVEDGILLGKQFPELFI